MSNNYDYVGHQREAYKQRTGFTDTDYFKVVSLSMKFYKQAVEHRRDISGHELTEEEINICAGLIQKMTKEIELAKQKFEENLDN
ncbi:hypothetical protein ABEY65_28045 [Priestia aryabhattai]|uniref:hypothetical protein n=1 Tax=Priestia aryabhattai TaxID=412384 RepID=UPI003D281484